ncbi:MAG: hypothetical protein Q8P46_01400 [Hyphomicrobiales bacterium]|nr:hypothetical protein [Hyphomicrobiales bacterium]
MSTLIITNGEAAVGLVRAAELCDAAFAWNDVLHEGPVPLTPDLASLSTLRADYFAGLGDIQAKTVHERFAARDRAFLEHRRYDRVSLWFEQDLYDQLQVIQILDEMSGRNGRGHGLFLLQAPSHIGAQKPDDLAGLCELQEEVSLDQRAIARAAWTAYRQPQPGAWAGFIDADTGALPHLKAAIARSVQDLPAPGTGLSRTEAQILLAVSKGADAPHIVFRVVQQLEQAAFMGDLSFWRWIDGLAFAPVPLIKGVREGGIAAARNREEVRAYLMATLSVSDAGRAVLAGKADFTALNPIDRWLGGTHLTKGNLWRWDEATGTLIAPRGKG